MAWHTGVMKDRLSVMVSSHMRLVRTIKKLNRMELTITSTFLLLLSTENHFES